MKNKKLSLILFLSIFSPILTLSLVSCATSKSTSNSSMANDAKKNEDANNSKTEEMEIPKFEKSSIKIYEHFAAELENLLDKFEKLQSKQNEKIKLTIKEILIKLEAHKKELQDFLKLGDSEKELKEQAIWRAQKDTYLNFLTKYIIETKIILNNFVSYEDLAKEFDKLISDFKEKQSKINENVKITFNSIFQDIERVKKDLDTFIKMVPSEKIAKEKAISKAQNKSYKAYLTNYLVQSTKILDNFK
ncbi:hypothetical protein [Mycoplasmopsis alligatoris]|uniref:Lipoprotein n=1 Tax=Mycoplasmopsis alligatoris A21JP2 TaxID=747682 RepID=D4XWQ1_9BACT|nr:hypothetical protein [Mycoplasmopsis alligatoris]EFF41195.1 hypothetical protein MALL_0377 [Mycoplasmopsis alligatoris A21JP2]